MPLIALLFAAVAAAFVSFFAVGRPQPITPMPEPVACTMEAKQCPDGSYVGRQGPNCEFAACPASTSTTPVMPVRKTLSGTVECIQPLDPSQPHTMECRYGLHTSENEYYALDFTLSSQPAPELEVGTELTASGVVTPIEMLSTDRWQGYRVNGIFSVTDVTR